MNRTNRNLPRAHGIAAIAAIGAFAVTASMLAVAGHMHNQLVPVDASGYANIAKTGAPATIDVAVLPKIDVVGVRDARTATNDVRRIAG
jgi:hypothetical protein